MKFCITLITTVVFLYCWGTAFCQLPPANWGTGVIDLSNTTNPLGIIIQGEYVNDLFGSATSDAGDVNGDGFDDFIIGARFASPNGKFHAGASYIIYGGNRLPSTIYLTNLNSTQGVVIQGPTTNAYSGFSVGNAGDINGDGFSDVIIGAPNTSPNGKGNSGTCYVIYGNSNLSNVIDLANFMPIQGIIIQGANANDYFGFSASNAGDINADGFVDIIVGAPDASPNGIFGAGASYVIYGSTNLSSTIDLSSLTASQGFVIQGANMLDSSGWSVRNAGDVNRDGFADVIVGVPYASPNGMNFAGISYVIYGNNGSPNATDLSNLTPAQGVIIQGASAGDASGYSVSSAGDVNADGFSDVIIGSYGTSPNGKFIAGTSYLIYGNNNLPGTIDFANFAPTQGVTIQGAKSHDESGISVSNAGDVNGDGFDDIMIGGVVYGIGKTTYVIYGNESLPSTIDLANLTSGQGVAIQVTSEFPSECLVSSVRDVNGDGLSDIIVGAPSNIDNQTNARFVFVIYGGLPLNISTNPSSSITHSNSPAHYSNNNLSSSATVSQLPSASFSYAKKTTSLSHPNSTKPTKTVTLSVLIPNQVHEFLNNKTGINDFTHYSSSSSEVSSFNRFD